MDAATQYNTSQQGAQRAGAIAPSASASRACPRTDSRECNCQLRAIRFGRSLTISTSPWRHRTVRRHAPSFDRPTRMRACYHTVCYVATPSAGQYRRLVALRALAILLRHILQSRLLLRVQRASGLRPGQLHGVGPSVRSRAPTTPHGCSHARACVRRACLLGSRTRRRLLARSSHGSSCTNGTS